MAPGTRPLEHRQYVVLNDLQIPFEDPPVLWDLVVPFVRELKPYGVILNGDIIDNHEISDFTKNPAWRHHDLKAERKSAFKLFDALAPVTKDRVFIEGNHEDRYRRYAWENASDFEAAGAIRTLPEYLKLEEHGFQHRPYGGHVMLGKLMVTHGFIVAQDSGTSAKRHFMRLGCSVLIGHTHRVGVYHKTNVVGDHAAFENGCLCRLDGLGYAQFPDWQQAFSVVDVFPGGMFNVTLLRILGRRAFIYGDTVVRRAKYSK
jgi:predicted phosphodiesterase